MHPSPVALVTGGSRGIGRGICVALAQAGYAVAVNYHSKLEAAEETRRLLGGVDSLLVQADVARAADRDRLIDAVLARWQRLDVLVNNAGITSVGRRDILEATEESWDQVLGANLKGAFFLSQRAAQEMIRLSALSPLGREVGGEGLPTQEQISPSPASSGGLRPAARHPCIINITSVSAYALSTNRGDYCIAKAGLSMATQLFALRLAEHGIRVYEVRPGIIDTDMTAAAKDQYTQLIADGLTPIRRWGTPEDVGRAVAALVGDGFPYSTGDVLHVDGGYHVRRFPR
jgi:3-oxoacyl-[acyl-carrier protein] reductase